jgi:hypothetical protein
VKNGKKLHVRNAIQKIQVIVGLCDVEKSRLFYTIMEKFSRLKEGTVPVPSLYPLLRIAIVRYYLFWGSSQLGGAIVAGASRR